MKYVDANIILRYILNDDRKMADYAESIIDSGSAFVLPEVLAEIVYVLLKVYKVERSVISSQLISLIQNIQTTDKVVMESALKYFAQTKLDFVDCILAAYHSTNGEDVCTFDKKLNNFIARL